MVREEPVRRPTSAGMLTASSGPMSSTSSRGLSDGTGVLGTWFMATPSGSMAADGSRRLSLLYFRNSSRCILARTTPYMFPIGAFSNIHLPN